MFVAKYTQMGSDTYQNGAKSAIAAGYAAGSASVQGGTAESIRLEIPCTNLRPVSAEKDPSVVVVTDTGVGTDETEKPVQLTTPTQLNAQPSPARQGGSAMDNDSAGFDRLRYLFWRYLDWRQRLKVLVDVDALPKTADQPVPQTMERIALETAAQNLGKLHDLWEAMMPLIPQEKRTQNPFKSDKR